MIRQLLDSLTGDTSYGALRRRLAALEQENARLRLNVARLQVENRHLRRSAELTSKRHTQRLNRQLRLVREAYFDAACLCAWYVAGLSISRRDCMASGMSPRKWARARALLRVGRIHNGHTLTIVNPDELHAALLAAKSTAEQDPSRLSYYMPRNP